MLNHLNAKELFEKITSDDDAVESIYCEMETFYNDAISKMISERVVSVKKDFPHRYNVNSIDFDRARKVFADNVKTRQVNENSIDYFVDITWIYDDTYMDYITGVRFTVCHYPTSGSITLGSCSSFN